MALNQTTSGQVQRVQVGDHAPDFVLPDKNGQPVRLSDVLRTGPVVLYFYPKDDTPGCTAEACSFRDNYEDFQAAGATVIGVSMDTAASHEAFANRYTLPFTLLSDNDGAVQRLYSVKGLFGLMRGRETFVIDRQGIVRCRFSSMLNVTRHASEALQVLQALPLA
jgi:peroxiredoxin Q/BCP